MKRFVIKKLKYYCEIVLIKLMVMHIVHNPVALSQQHPKLVIKLIHFLSSDDHYFLFNISGNKSTNYSQLNANETLSMIRQRGLL